MPRGRQSSSGKNVQFVTQHLKTYIQVTGNISTVNEKEAMNMIKSKKGHMRGLGRRKAKGGIIQFYYILKKNKINNLRCIVLS